ncbi:MAG: hypothetical protein PHT46_00900 [Candidatus Marinimicrobia bacterium]|jgi:hypothetical protein|nr:hypothetical protein [Candidatus Neomarinimicrobiota bacterium]MDD5710068.1 hypothetical protein [Candidatus Neomarinimicrobiota bacterium]
MKQFWILLQTEYRKRQSSYWLPVWIIAGVALLILLLLLGALIGNWNEIRVGFVNLAFDYEDVYDGVKIASLGIMMMMAFVFTLFMLMNSQNSLSKERELGCELFYRCQPVNIWSSTVSRYLMHIYAGSLLLLGLGIITALITAIITACTVGGFYLGCALYGSLLGWLIYLKICIVFGSMYFLFSAVFRNNAFIKGTAMLGIIELVFYLIEEMFHRTILLPDIFKNLFVMIGSLKADNDLSLAIVLGDVRLIAALLFAGACYAGATLIYKQKRAEV